MNQNPVKESVSTSSPIAGSCALLLAAIVCSAPSARALTPQNETILPTVPMANDGFGASMATGVLSTASPDSWIVVGRPGVLSGAGVVEGIPPPSLPPTRIVFTAPGSHFQAGAAFGSAVAVADINNDGIQDIVVGALGQPVVNPGDQIGRAFVFFGPWTPGATPPYANWCYLDVLPGERDRPTETGNHFGASLAVGHLAGGLGFDIVVGCPTATFVASGGGRRLEAGAADIFFGASLVPNGGVAAYTRYAHLTDPQTGAGNASAGDHFGTSLAIGQFGNTYNGGSSLPKLADIAVGVPDATASPLGTPIGHFGGVHIYFGYVSTAGVNTWDNTAPFREVFLGYSVPTSPYFFGLGTALAAIDYDSDGWDDLAVGAPGSSLPCVELGHGSSGIAGLTGNAPGDVLLPPTSVGATRFGASLAWMHRWGPTVPDLAVGTLNAVPWSFTEHVDVFQGGSGPTFGLWANVETDLDPNPSGSYPPTGFGTCIASGQRGLTIAADLCIGSPLSNGGGTIRSGAAYAYWR